MKRYILKMESFHLDLPRADIDIQPNVDHTACLKYTAKYTSKAEKMSSIIQDGFTCLVQN